MNATQLRISIPVYNESSNIVEVLERIKSKVSVPYRVIIIYDFDEDDTIPAVNKYIEEGKRQDIFLVKNRFGSGALNAIITGFDIAGDGPVLVVMADSSDDLSIVNTMFSLINRGYDVVCGSRYIPGGSQIGGPRLKKYISKTVGVSLHLITGIPTHDISNSFKMYSPRILKNTRIESRGGFEVGMEIAVKGFLRNYKITEIPSTWRDRSSGKSRFKIFRWAPGYLKWYLYAVRGVIWNRFRGPQDE